MKCVCTAKPKPEVTWLKETKKVTEGGRVRMKIEESGDVYTLMLEIQVKK